MYHFLPLVVFLCYFYCYIFGEEDFFNRMISRVHYLLWYSQPAKRMAAPSHCTDPKTRPQADHEVPLVINSPLNLAETRTPFWSCWVPDLSLPEIRMPPGDPRSYSPFQGKPEKRKWHTGQGLTDPLNTWQGLDKGLAKGLATLWRWGESKVGKGLTNPLPTAWKWRRAYGSRGHDRAYEPLEGRCYWPIKGEIDLEKAW